MRAWETEVQTLACTVVQSQCEVGVNVGLLVLECYRNGLSNSTLDDLVLSSYSTVQ